jgi:hypothetical protein
MEMNEEQPATPANLPDMQKHKPRWYHTTPAYEALGGSAAIRLRRWSAYFHKTPDADELTAIRRSGETGLPYSESAWVNRLSND